MAERTVAPNYGIVYNWDGAPHGYSEYPQSLAQFLDKVYAPLADTQVGALCWCVGVHEVPWPSQQLDMVGASTERRYDSVQTMRHTENIRAFFERGDDLYGALVQRGRELGMAVLPSLRMNDNHFWDLRPGDLGGLQRSELTPMRQQHPEWLLGEEQAPGWASTSWNMAIPKCERTSCRASSKPAAWPIGTGSNWIGSGTPFTCQPTMRTACATF